nr:MAG TPA: hypothetical protein [Caudoviricetes sp.]
MKSCLQKKLNKYLKTKKNVSKCDVLFSIKRSQKNSNKKAENK